jgi:hypothetical protein
MNQRIVCVSESTLLDRLEELSHRVDGLAAKLEYDPTPVSLSDYIRGRGKKASPTNVEKLYQELVRLQYDPVMKGVQTADWEWQRGQLDEAWQEAYV